MSRKLAREEAMKLIYQMDVNNITAEEVIKTLNDAEIDKDVNEENRVYMLACVNGVHDKRELIDSYIEKYSRGWKINRIAKVDLAIMRLAIFEMLEIETVPPVVAVNEAIEIAKKFSGENSSSFINGILGNVIKEIKIDGEDTRN